MNWRKIVHYLLLVLVALYIISGLGILYPRIVTPLTLGLMDKAVSFQIHFYLLIPFLIVLIAHIILTTRLQSLFRKK